MQVLTGPSSPLTGITAIAGGIGSGYALDNQGQVWVWGNNSLFAVRMANMTGATMQASAGPTGLHQATVTAAVYDAYNNPVPGAVVSFQVSSGSGTLASPTATTDASGLATDTVTGSAPGTVTVQAGSGTLTAAPVTVSFVDITTAGLPDGLAGDPYSATLAAAGGNQPYTWSATGLPPGLSISTGGVISGTPTTAGTSSVAVTVTDGTGNTASQNISLTVNPVGTLSITTTSLPGGTVGTSYSVILAVGGGSGSYTWSATGLPAGLSISSGGVISGTPTAAGTSSVAVTVTDDASNTASASLGLTVSQSSGGGGGGGTSATPQPISITTGSATVNPAAGGTVSLGSAVSLTIPAGALAGDASVPVTVQPASSVAAPPSGFQVLGTVYQFTVNSQNHYTFNGPVTLSFTFDPSKLPAGETPAVYYYDETAGKWIDLGGTVSGNTITVKVSHFTRYAVMAGTRTSPASPAVTLSDIAGNWAEKNIEKLVEMGVISGYPDETFRPNSSITRAEFATMLVKAFKFAPAQGKTFADTVKCWAKDYIATAAANSIVKGYSDTYFGPDDQITREQMAVMTIKATKLSSASGELDFTDSGKISPWARDAVFRAVKAGIIKGYPNNTFRPEGNATRAEAVTIIVNAINLQ